MAKRFNVSIPDALAERMEPFKNDLSLSALMQDAIERELIQLTMSDKDKELRENFKKTAVHAWANRLHGLRDAVNAFAKHLVNQAALDSNPAIFDLYRFLYLNAKQQEILESVKAKELELSQKAKVKINPKDEELGPEAALIYEHFIDNELLYLNDFGSSLVKFINQKATAGELFFGSAAYETDRAGAIRLGDDVEAELVDFSNITLQSFYLEMLHAEVSALMPEQEIKAYLCDLDLEMLVLGELG